MMIGAHYPDWKRTIHPGPPRLWPWVLAGMVVAALVWAYNEPIPEHTHPEPMVMQVP